MRKSDPTAIAQFKTQVQILAVCVVLMWGVEIVDLVVFRGRLDLLGVRPRNLQGLWGIPLMPLLHSGWGHLMANTLPFATLGWLVMVRRIRDFFVVTAIATLVGGLGVWLLGGHNTVHIGASGVVFGYLGYLLLRGYFERSLMASAIAIAVALAYGGLLWGVLPGQRGVSWEGHLFGFIGGGIAAYLLADRPSKPQHSDPWDQL